VRAVEGTSAKKHSSEARKAEEGLNVNSLEELMKGGTNAYSFPLRGGRKFIREYV